ncbi:MAG: LD-carboxypeptidase [Bacillota bacterium]|nr:LD-carboxypeptidase [Bacillota bacterium]MDD3297439.1 LD-carboxypeptidase [Bacillota bacterium]MDD3850251.1 LD-carboxypeptidase [Bacillota bacterium]MDD4707208.1 LD-carboxypeptidase [Bacillota bacterium]
MLKAQRLCQGDSVGLVCPAGPVKEHRLESGIATLRSMGLKVKLGDHVRATRGYLAGSDRDRAEDINKMFRDRSIKGIFCARGGFGTTRILDALDYDTLRQNPKVFIGYSDITALHLAIRKRAGLVTFHGPMVAEMTGDFPGYNRCHIGRALFSDRPVGKVTNPEGEVPPQVLFPGRAEGPIRGGNLSLLCSTLGTPYEIDTRGCIFFLEEVGEPPYKIDRMLTHIGMAGKIKDAAALVFGRWKDCTDERNPEPSVEDLLADIAARERKPCLSNLMIGHDRFNITIPLSCRGLIEEGKLHITESGVL